MLSNKVENGRLTEEDGPPYDMTIFKKYLQYTYMACGQVGGVEAPDVANIGPLVLAAEVERHEPRVFDFASYLVDRLHEGFLNLKDNPDKYFKHYSLLMHIVLFYGKLRGLWPEELNVNTLGKDGKEQPVQLWVSFWDYRFVNSHYLKFEEFFVKSIFLLFGEPWQGSFSEEDKKFLRPHEHQNPKVNKNWGDWYSCQNVTFV